LLALEEVVMAVKTRRDYFGLTLGIDTSQIVAASRMGEPDNWLVVQPNKAVVGANAFAHASGIHQDGVLKARDTYEIMRAEDVGWAANKIVLGKLSGRNAFKQRLHDLGIELESEADINAAFARFKDLADRKSDIFDEDIIALVSDESVTHEQEHYRLLTLDQRSATGERPHARVAFALGTERMSCGQRRQRPGRRMPEGDRVTCEEWGRTGALFGQCHHQRQHRIARRGDHPIAAWRSGRQWCGG
jgi:2-isopropylmalate synthase